jgi:hypothetical protein
MKRKFSFIDKLRIFIHWMSDHKDYGLIATCSICQSTRLKRLDGSTETENTGGVLYCASYECMDCHATAKCFEDWKV